MASTIRELGDLVRIRTGKLDANANDPTGCFPFFTCAREPLRISSFSYDCECVLVAGNGDLNVKYYEGKFDAYQRTYIIESADKSQLDVRYLYYFMDLYLEQLRLLSIGGVIKYIKLDNLTEAKIPVPPLTEQRRIASILDQADALRVKRREALAQLDILTQSIFIEMFGDLLLNPNCFPVRKLGDICDVRDGTHDSPRFLSDGYPLVTTKNLSNGQIDLTDAGLISKDDYEAINKRSRVDRGDILMPMIGTIGNPVLVKIDPVFAIKNVALIKFHDSSPDRHFILHLLRSPYFNSLVAKMQKGGTQKFLALGLIRSLPIPVPPDFIQQKFTSLMKAVEKHSSLLTASGVDFEELFACLQRRAFLGEL